jgi:hypothetical protein
MSFVEHDYIIYRLTVVIVVRKGLETFALKTFMSLDPATAFLGARDRLRLQSEFPGLGEYRQTAKRLAKMLRPYYNDYLLSVSGAAMAVSLPLAIFLYAISHSLRPTRILDLGSGFSSVVFRLYGAESPSPVEVWSVDDSGQWLERTRRFVIRHGLPSGQFHLWESFEREPGRFDLVLHDLGDMDKRASTLRDVLRLARVGGFTVLDDVHYWRYNRHVRNTLGGLGLRKYSLRSFTLDEFGRYSLLVVR